MKSRSPQSPHRAVQHDRDGGLVAEVGDLHRLASLLDPRVGEVVEGAAPVVGGAGGDRDEVGRADVGEATQLRGHRLLVAHDRHVGRARGALAVEDGSVHGNVAVARELLVGLGAAVGFVVGDDRGQRDDDARRRAPGRASRPP